MQRLLGLAPGDHEEERKKEGHQHHLLADITQVRIRFLEDNSIILNNHLIE